MEKIFLKAPNDFSKTWPLSPPGLSTDSPRISLKKSARDSIIESGGDSPQIQFWSVNSFEKSFVRTPGLGKRI